jgi:DNA-directed RNA polymerase sigma subunit (sigma70/sigma32)
MMRSNEAHKFVDNPEGLYLSEVLKVPPLSPDEETRCLQQVRAGDEQAEPARKHLLEANLHLVVSIVERNHNERIHFLDLIVKGNDALMGALQAFGASGEDSFSVYAAACIERAIAEALASPDPVRIPPAKRDIDEHSAGVPCR